MRQLQKLQMGMALVALVLCLFPATLLVGPTRASTVRNVNGKQHVNHDASLSSVVGDSSVIWYRSTFGHAEERIASMSRGDGRAYGTLLGAVSHARKVHVQSANFPYLCVFYKPNGQVDQEFRMSSHGLLKDIHTGEIYQPDETFAKIIRRRIH